jgi:hypothetical protein
MSPILTQIPQNHGPIKAAGNRLARGTEGDAVHRFGVPPVLAQLLASRGVPPTHGPVVATRQYALAIRREHRRSDRCRVALEDAQTFAGVGVP